LPTRSAKRKRQEEILLLIRSQRVHSQDELRELLHRRGFDVTQATLSRDLKELRVGKVPHAEGESYYATAVDPEDPAPALERLLPHLFTSAEGVGNLVVVKTLTGAAQPVAEAIDLEAWPEVIGTVAGDDTILLILRQAGNQTLIISRIKDLARR
jgi:transcriptional regulator of arginine metabolism